MDKTENLKQYDEMQHAQLRQILREYQESDVAGIGEEAAFYIMELLSREEKVSTRKAWKTFCREYHPDAEVTHTGRLRGVYRLAVTSVLVSVLLATGIFAAANSFGSGNPPNLSGEQFYFEAPNTPTVSEKDKMMGEALTQLANATSKNVDPEVTAIYWVPDRFDFLRLDVFEENDRNNYSLIFDDGESYLIYNAYAYTDESFANIERIEDKTEIYKRCGVEFCLFHNVDRTCISWNDKNYVYLISGNITRDEAIHIIENIAISPETEKNGEKQETLADAYHKLCRVTLKNENTIPEIPMWIPDGYRFVELSIEQTSDRNFYALIFDNGDSLLSVDIILIDEENPIFWERTEGSTKVYEKEGTTYYIFKNIDRMKIWWKKGVYEYLVSANITEEEAKKMIDSIGGTIYE